MSNDYPFFMTYLDYLFRWDKGSFWLASKRLDYTLWNRLTMNTFLSTENLYNRAKRRSVLERESKKINQDMIIPYSDLNNFLELNKKTHAIYPIWLLPIKNTSSEYLFGLPKKIYILI